LVSRPFRDGASGRKGHAKFSEPLGGTMKRAKSTMLLLGKAMAASFLINIAMILLPILGGGTGIHAVFLRISDAIAAPAGLFASAFSPKQHMAGAFALAAVECLVVSFLIYALVMWAALWCLNKIVIHFERNDGAA